MPIDKVGAKRKITWFRLIESICPNYNLICKELLISLLKTEKINNITSSVTKFYSLLLILAKFTTFVPVGSDMVQPVHFRFS